MFELNVGLIIRYDRTLTVMLKKLFCVYFMYLLPSFFSKPGGKVRFFDLKNVSDVT